MNSLAALLAPAALLLPAMSLGLPAVEDAAHAAPGQDKAQPGITADVPEAYRIIESLRQVKPGNQVRIEQRVIIRISPGPASAREEMIDLLPRRQMRAQVLEEPIGECVPIQEIAAVEPGEANKLLLFMRNRRILTAALERACSAHDFYSGFYVERSGDGLLCRGRDQLQSRAGATCSVARFSRLVAVRE